MLKAAQNNLREQSFSCDLRREVEGGQGRTATNELPVNASLRQLRNQAKDLLRSQRAGLPDAFHRIQRDRTLRSRSKVSP